MKKILSLVMALTMVLGLNAAPVALKQLKASKTPSVALLQKQKALHKAPMAEGVTFTFAGESDLEQSKSGISLVIAKGSGSSDPAWISNSNQLRVYANNTITVSGSGIKKIELTCGLGKAGKAYADMVANCGSLVSGGESSAVGEFKTDTWTGSANKVVFTIGTGQREIKSIVVYTDGGTPTPPTPGDTTALTMLDAFEFGYYGSYSEEGAYNYMLAVYNSQDENYVPYVSFDIYTEAQNEFTGKFSAEGGNLGLDYSAFFPDAESEGEYFTSATVTITEGEGDDLVIEGIFTTEAGATYTFSVTAEPYIYDAEHPYEPQEAKTFDLTAVDGETDDTYFADYGIAYFYLDMEDGSYVGLTYRTANGTEPEGTFSILDDENEDAFLTGADYYGYPDGSYYETIEGDVYYFVSGSVTLATDDIGNTNITINATSVYGSTFTVTGTVPAPQPTPGHTIVFADYAEEDLENFTTLDGAYTVATDKNGGTEPAYNTNGEDLRLYAKNKMTLTKNTKDGPMTEITFNISTKGLTRQAEIAVSTGEIVIYDMDNAIVVWKGEASEVTFTVGDKNVYGSDGKDKAGQFDFTSLDVEGGITGLISTKVNKVASKCLINGQLMIIKNDAIYNFQGNLVK